MTTQDTSVQACEVPEAIEVDGQVMRLLPVGEAAHRRAVLPPGGDRPLPTLEVDTLLGGFVSLRWDIDDPDVPPHAYTIFAATERVYVGG